MKKSLILIYVLLLILTLTTSCIAGFSVFSKIGAALIMTLAAFKFLLVAFQFMELKKAHSLWKISLIITLGLFVILIIGIK
ncbi:cytochrome c oxidase subunit IV [Flavobacterium sp. 1]|uniref:cytochrome C oxidase subunit IV family protein n=1 Tax=Flavobacterium sp. 1 TaxID=2035200 RepID=UPI000C23E60C|nr:cytochrome C oxidase subunit IV family protein [Flavobacterium sp. 1]PJJ09198.1 cytochrome c oxidase subunit IV [Flavobacterium sp. 1]